MSSGSDSVLESLAETALPVSLRFEAGRLAYRDYIADPAKSRRGKRYPFRSVAGKNGTLHLGETPIAAVQVADEGGAVSLAGPADEALQAVADAEVEVVVSAGSAWLDTDSARPAIGDVIVLDQVADQPLQVFMRGAGAVWMLGEALTFGDSLAVRLLGGGGEPRRTQERRDMLHVEVIYGRATFPLSEVTAAGEGTICPLDGNPLDLFSLTCSGHELAKGYLEVADRGSEAKLAFVVTQVPSGSDSTKPVREPEAAPPAFREVPLSVDQLLSAYPKPRLSAAVRQGDIPTAVWVAKRLARVDLSSAGSLFEELQREFGPEFVRAFASAKPGLTEKSIGDAVASYLASFLSKEELDAAVEEVEAFEVEREAMRGPDRDDHLITTANVFSHFPERVARELIETVQSENPDAGAKIRRNLVFCEDIARLSDRDIQKVLREVDMSVLVHALSNETEDVRKAVLRNMSSRAARILEEELRLVGNPTSERVDDGKSGLVRVMEILRENGEISL